MRDVIIKGERVVRISISSTTKDESLLEAYIGWIEAKMPSKILSTTKKLSAEKNSSDNKSWTPPIIMARTDSFTQASPVWSKWPTNGDAERGRNNILQEFLVNATRDVRRDPDKDYTTHSQRTHVSDHLLNKKWSGSDSVLLTSGARYVRICT